jgi:hypothetical protein
VSASAGLVLPAVMKVDTVIVELSVDKLYFENLLNVRCRYYFVLNQQASENDLEHSALRFEICIFFQIV